MSCDPAANGFQITENYVLGPSGEDLSMVDGTNTWQRTNVYVGGRLMATYDQAGLHFHLSDPLGTRRVQLSGNLTSPDQTQPLGQAELDCQSLPYGDQQSCTPAPNAPPSSDDATPLHFTGKERDAESGNDYFGARYYASSMGRFMSPDYSDDDSQGEPVPFFNPSNPQTLNLFSYAHDNPFTGSDPDGHDVNVCTTGSDGNQQCTEMSNDQYQAAQQASNGSLNVPTLDQVGSNGNGSGQFNSTAITDSSGNIVGTATYVSDGGADYYANANGYQTLATASRGMKQVTAGYGIVFGAGMVAADIAAGAGLTTLGDLSPNAQFTEHGVQRLAQRGITPGQVQEAIDAAKKTGDVVQKIGKYGTKQLEYTANGLKVFVEQEGANAGKVITAYFH